MTAALDCIATMRRLIYITLFSLIFLLVALYVLNFGFSEALPITLLGGCLGWALAEFQREVRAKKKIR